MYRDQRRAALAGALLLAAPAGPVSAAPAPRPPAPRSAPARTAAQASPYFIPGEWVAQVKAGRVQEVSATYLQGLAIYLYQHQDWAMRDAQLGWVAGLFSCADAAKLGNEVERPDVYARTRAALQRFFADPPRQGSIQTTAALGPYDAASQRFTWAAKGDIFGREPGAPRYALAGLRVDGKSYSCDVGRVGTVYGTVPSNLVMTISGLSYPGVGMAPAKASAFIASHSSRLLTLDITLRVPGAQGAGGVAANAYQVGTGTGRVSVEAVGANLTELNRPGEVIAPLGA